LKESTGSQDQGENRMSTELNDERNESQKYITRIQPRSIPIQWEN